MVIESIQKIDLTSGAVKAEELTPRDVAKFTLLVALSAIFIDATLGHGLLWENDPYWTYWVTKTFLIATIFGLGTAWAGIGIGRGAAITAVHTVVLTVYYWSLSPIGLPSNPEWLDLEHTWVTGVPIHFGVIFGGYVLALWLWNRRAARVEVAETSKGYGLSALLLGVVVVALAGLSSTIIAGFPGVTWFVVRLLLTVTFIIGWRAAVGRDAVAAVTGGVMLALVWAAYSHYLGPSGLPDLPVRILDPLAPGAAAKWLTYKDVWLVSLPIHALLMSSVLLFDSFRVTEDRSYSPLTFPLVLAVVLIGAALVYPTVYKPTEATMGTIGTARVESGEWLSGSFEDAPAKLTVTAKDAGTRVSPLPPHDEVNLVAKVDASDGVYEIIANHPIVEDPAGRFTTWWGVGINVEHHGKSGIGTQRLPEVKSPLAIFATGNVTRDGEPVANNVPVHFMTSESPMMGGAKAELDVGDPDLDPVVGLPDGHLRVVWNQTTGAVPKDGHIARYLLGSVVLVMFLIAGFGLIRRDERSLV